MKMSDETKIVGHPFSTIVASANSWGLYLAKVYYVAYSM